ncbi:hypothetical protein MtrunA17_Chr2g0333601 [Medicago truncatula]|uniref:Nodule Cysteine-Rich (NCR) secreted peptide n=1 Tax=Medicago truncatula TaxID=3880 RepID=G7IMB5_MEDTR|nr:Nodule Cysteine-Rich (NCR) secreted peptide [Medicago truncatula]AFK43372.1 unknown [Medicago truncatula]RHN76573.1 hypothetical protein MtrunA17_Chr2g0333601 [Medicago truncatula]
MGQIQKFISSLIIIISLVLVVTCNCIPMIHPLLYKKRVVPNCQTIVDCPDNMCTHPKEVYCIGYRCYCLK